MNNNQSELKFQTSKKIQINSFICNIFSGGVNAIQSIIILMLVTRFCSIEEAGLFSLAYASASLFLMAGYYGMRVYQVSDTFDRFKWSEYHTSRVVTTALMISMSVISGTVMMCLGEYSLNKNLIIIGVTILKALDAYEDIYHGKYQKDGRLDIAGFCMGLRLLIQMIAFSILLILNVPLLASVYLVVFIGIAVLVWELYLCNPKFIWERKKCEIKQLKALLIACFPLGVSNFLAFYLNNMSKYEIDMQLTEIEQAYYGFLTTPLYVVYLFSNFIYIPLLGEISYAWNNNNNSKFNKLVTRVFGIILGVGVIVIVLGVSIGRIMLEIMYGVELKMYTSILLILLIGGTLYACVTFFISLLTIIRKQKILLILNAIIVILSKIITYYFVLCNQLDGAAYAYACSMFIMLCSCIIVFFYYKKEAGHKKGEIEND